MKTSLFRFCGVLLLAAMLAPVCVHARKNPKNPKNNMRLLPFSLWEIIWKPARNWSNEWSQKAIL